VVRIGDEPVLESATMRIRGIELLKLEAVGPNPPGRIGLLLEYPQAPPVEIGKVLLIRSRASRQDIRTH